MGANSDLTAAQVAKRYGKRWALSGVDVAVPSGSITALVGPNGAGKTTLLRMWMGFERPTTGQISVLGVDPWTRREVVGEVAFLAQTPSLYRELRVREHLDLIAGLRPTFDVGLAQRRLTDLGIDAGAVAGALSGGEAAQVGLALAIGLRARVILLDEPLASLDPLARRDFLAILVAHAREAGATVVLSSHIVSDIEQSCDRLLAIGSGRAALQGSIAGILATHWVVRGNNTEGAVRAGGPSDTSTVIESEQRPATAERQATLDEIIIAELLRLKAAA